MRRAATLLALGFLLGIAGFAGTYFLGTNGARQLETAKVPELGWLKKEFNLGDAEFDRICELHASYQPKCAEMCRRVDAKNAEVREALAHADHVTPEIRTALSEAAQLRAECQQAMLEHFFEVSRTMPPGQGKRYLEWVEGQTFLPMHGMSATTTESPHVHGEH